MDLPAIRTAVGAAGYTVPPLTPDSDCESEFPAATILPTLSTADLSRAVLRLLVLVFGVMLFIVVV